MRPKQLYVVLKGRKTGIFNTWGGDDGAEAQTSGFSCAEFKGKFYDIDDAKSYFRNRMSSEPDVHFDTPNHELYSGADGKNYITYVLIDPRSKQPFYVGQSSDFTLRKAVHSTAKRNPFRKVDKYIAELASEGFSPEFYIAETCNNLDASLRSELKWVRYCLEKGYSLCNRWKEHRESPK